MALHPFPAADPQTQGGPPAISFGDGGGHLSLNPIAGCSVGCPFCFNLADHIGPERQALASIDQVLATLVAHEAAVRRLRLSVLDLCDPFDATVRPLLRALLEGLAALLPDQVVLLTSRLHPGAAVLDWLKALPLRVSVFVSLGDATGRVRPVTPVQRRLSLLEDCRARGLHAAMMLRPLVAEWCEPRTLGRLLELAERCCDELVVSGLNLTSEIEASLRARGWPVPAQAAGGGDLAPELRSLIARTVRSVPVSEHRACAINRHRRLRCEVLRQRPAGDGPGQPPVISCCGADVHGQEPRVGAGRPEGDRAGGAARPAGGGEGALPGGGGEGALPGGLEVVACWDEYDRAGKTQARPEAGECGCEVDRRDGYCRLKVAA